MMGFRLFGDPFQELGWPFPVPNTDGNFLLLEDGFHLLLEDSSKLILG